MLGVRADQWAQGVCPELRAGHSRHQVSILPLNSILGWCQALQEGFTTRRFLSVHALVMAEDSAPLHCQCCEAMLTDLECVLMYC